MEAVHQNFVTNAAIYSRQLLDLAGKFEIENTLWAGAPDYDTIIDQANIDTVGTFHSAGLTAQQLADAMYAHALIKQTIDNALVALTVLNTCV